MAAPEAYMLSRDGKESQRLDLQHVWIKGCAHNHLLHPTIPLQAVQAIADVATGTGAWLHDVARSWKSLKSACPSQPRLVGFDISASQFPNQVPAGIEFVVHDATQPPPPQFVGTFDVVNIRLMSYAITQTMLRDVVVQTLALLRRSRNPFDPLQSLTECIGPGGYLQWQECDAIDAFAHSETPLCRKIIAAIVEERVSRGLFPAISAPLIQTLASVVSDLPRDYINPLNWSNNTFRITQVQTISTVDHPVPVVREQTKSILLKTMVALLKSGLESRKRATSHASTDNTNSPPTSTEELAALIASIESEQGDIWSASWDGEMTWIVGRKAHPMDQGGDWMSIRYSGQ